MDAFPRLWERCTTNGAPDVQKMYEFMLECNEEPRRNGRWLVETLVERGAEFEQKLKEQAHPEAAPEAHAQADLDNFSEVSVLESPKSPKHEPIDTSQFCEDSLISEANERLLSILKVCFGTDSGRIQLENDLALYDGDKKILSKETWLAEMRETWSQKLHSGWLDEFMEALELWVIASDN